MSEQPEAVPAQYSNQAKLQYSVYDFTMDFGRIENPEAQGARFFPIARIQMSPQHAKVFALMLLRHLAMYEHQMGIIELPASMLEQMRLLDLQHFISQVNIAE